MVDSKEIYGRHTIYKCRPLCYPQRQKLFDITLRLSRYRGKRDIGQFFLLPLDHAQKLALACLDY